MKRKFGLAIAAIALISGLVAGGLIALNGSGGYGSTQTPTPDLTASPTPAPAINASSVGICVHTLTEKDANFVTASGAKWVRIDCSDTLSDFNASVRTAKTNDLSVLGILDSWMFSKSCVFTLDDWRENVTYYVKNYAPYVDAWEIWNEPTSPTYPLLNLNLTNAEAERNMGTIVDFYYNMTETAHTIIRQHDPDATIILLGGINLYSGSDPNLGLDLNFSKQLSAKGIGRFGDAIALHAYPWTNESTSQFFVNYSDSLDRYRGLFPNHEIWITETGQKLNNSIDAIQAEYMSQALSFFAGKADYVFWYALYDDHFDDRIDYFGLVDADLNPREAYQALAAQLGCSND